MQRERVSREILQSAELFAGLPARDLDALAICLQGRRYAAGEILFREGEPGASMLIVAEGTLMATARGGDGQERVLGPMHAAEVVGEMAFLDPGPRSATVAASTEAVVYELTQDTREILRARSPAAFGAILSAAIRDVMARIDRLDARIFEALEARGLAGGAS
jgi:CRP-like cAMP-binding protein